MSQRNSEYERIPGDLYVTPKWVYDALFEVEKFRAPWDCAPINAEFDFLEMDGVAIGDIVTNPPFFLSERFCRHAIALTKDIGGKVAMLLPHAWDTAKRRRDLFEAGPFKVKYTLTQRIRWENVEQKKAGPSMNHSWFLWDWQYEGPPTIGWLPAKGGRP